MFWGIDVIVLKVITGFACKIGINKLYSFTSSLLAKGKNKQPTLHIALPSDPTGPAKGDALLQGAGFLAARDQFGDLLKIEFHDHKGDNAEIRKIIDGIIDDNKVDSTNNATPIWAIFTMSTVSQTVRNKLESIDDSSIKERLSIIFTVSSAPETPSDRINYFQHFITGESEAKEIIKHCMTVKGLENSDRPRVHFLGMNSPYSSETIKHLSSELVKNKFTCTYIELGDDGCISKDDQNEIRHNSNENTFCIVIAYDKYLLRALDTLSRIKYKGHIISTATLSVPDWQDYLKQEMKLHINGLNLKYVKIRGFGESFTGGYKTFCDDLKKWTFEKVTAEKALYPNDIDWTREQFDHLEKDVYKTIKPNYISAFCYDSVRLFSKLAESKGKLLKQIYEDSEKHIKSQDSPFANNINITILGRVSIELSVETISL